MKPIRGEGPPPLSILVNACPPTRTFETREPYVMVRFVSSAAYSMDTTVCLSLAEAQSLRAELERAIVEAPTLPIRDYADEWKLAVPPADSNGGAL